MSRGVPLFPRLQILRRGCNGTDALELVQTLVECDPGPKQLTALQKQLHSFVDYVSGELIWYIHFGSDVTLEMFKGFHAFKGFFSHVYQP